MNEQFNEAIINSGYTARYIAAKVGISESSIYKWRHGTKPRDESKYKKALEIAKSTKPIEWSQSIGYMTKDQWEKLTSLGIGPERDELKKQIEEQNKRHGRVA